jgi:uncharacterized protein YhfF
MTAAPTPPDAKAVAEFWAMCKRALPHMALGEAYRTRCIGGTPQMNAVILTYIAAGQKVGTFPLPQQLAAQGEPLPRPGDCTIQLAFDGTPKLLVRTVSAEVLPFKAITAAHTAIDGPPVRELDAWRKVHIPYYTQILKGLGLAFSDDTPVCVERFEYLYGQS